MASCDSCHAEIDWALLPSGKRIPLDRATAGDPKGNLAVKRLDDGSLHARYLKNGDQPGASEVRGISHFATCEFADQHRKSNRKSKGTGRTR